MKIRIRRFLHTLAARAYTRLSRDLPVRYENNPHLGSTILYNGAGQVIAQRLPCGGGIIYIWIHNSWWMPQHWKERIFRRLRARAMPYRHSHRHLPTAT